VNRSNFTHAAYALVIQAALGLALAQLGVTNAWWIAGALPVGFFIGVEWMQRLRQIIEAAGGTWPAPVNAALALRAFLGWTRDRYGDAGIPLLACALAANAAPIWRALKGALTII